jgi:Tol biopolymer transport system component
MRAIDVTTGENRILGFCLDNHCEGALSPDGTRLVYGAEEHLKIQSIATGDAEPLLTPGVDEAAAPVWSPDGRTIAFQGNDGIYAIEVETERLDRLYELPDGESLALPPAWSPDGSTLAFLESRPLPDSPNQERSFTVVRVGADGSDPRELHAAGHCVCLGLPAPTVTWTPDGEQITVTVTQSAEGAGLYTMAPDGTDWTLLRPGVYGDVDWQPLVE